jgi:myb proto-oncogene protein
LVSNNDPATALPGKWTADEDKKLKDAVPAHGEKNWEEIATLVPGRTSRWQNALVSNIDPTTALGKWIADEDR